MKVDRGLQTAAGLKGLGDCGDGVVEVVSRSVAVAFSVEGVDSYRHRAVPVAAAAGTFVSKLYFVFRKHPIEHALVEPFTCRLTVLALGVVDVVRRESVLSHELV